MHSQILHDLIVQVDNSRPDNELASNYEDVLHVSIMNTVKIGSHRLIVLTKRI